MPAATPRVKEISTRSRASVSLAWFRVDQVKRKLLATPACIRQAVVAMGLVQSRRSITPKNGWSQWRCPASRRQDGWPAWRWINRRRLQLRHRVRCDPRLTLRPAHRFRFGLRFCHVRRRRRGHRCRRCRSACHCLRRLRCRLRCGKRICHRNSPADRRRTESRASIEVHLADKSEGPVRIDGSSLDQSITERLFARDGSIDRIEMTIPRDMLRVGSV